MNNNFNGWCDKHKGNPKSQRLGQAFWNTYLKGSRFHRAEWSELFHEKDDEKSKEMIREWLTRHHYYKTLPSKD